MGKFWNLQLGAVVLHHSRMGAFWPIWIAIFGSHEKDAKSKVCQDMVRVASNAGAGNLFVLPWEVIGNSHSTLRCFAAGLGTVLIIREPRSMLADTSAQREFHARQWAEVQELRAQAAEWQQLSNFQLRRRSSRL